MAFSLRDTCGRSFTSTFQANMPYSSLFHAMYPDNGRCGETFVRPGIDLRQMQRFVETASEVCVSWTKNLCTIHLQQELNESGSRFAFSYE